MERCDWLKKNMRFDPFFDPILKTSSILPRISYIQLTTTVSFVSFWTKNKSSCLDVEKEEKLRLSQRHDHSGLDFSSQLDESTDFSEKDTMPTESDPAHQYTWLPSSNTCLLKSWSWLETLPVTTRKQELFHDIFNSPSATTKNWTSFCRVLPSPPVVCCQTSKLSCSPRRTRNKPRNRSSRPLLNQKAIFIATHLKNKFGSRLKIIFARHFYLGKVVTDNHLGLHVRGSLPSFSVLSPGEVCELTRARALAYGNKSWVVPFASAFSHKLYTVQFCT